MLWANSFLRKGVGYLLFAHPVVNLLSVPVEELQVHTLLILLPTNLPQIQQRLLLLCKDAQLKKTIRHTFMNMVNGSVQVKIQ